MPIFALAPAAATAFWSAVSAGTIAGTQIYGAHKQAGAAREATSAQLTAANESARLQKESTDAALAAQERARIQDQLNFEQSQRANYDQWRSGEQFGTAQWQARDRRIGSLGELAGLPARVTPNREIPAYAGPGWSGGGATADPKLASAIAAYQMANPAQGGIAPLTAALKKQGFAVDRFLYGATPSDNELSVGGQKYKVLGAENTPGAYWYRPGMDDSAPGTLRRLAG